MYFWKYAQTYILHAIFLILDSGVNFMFKK